MKPKVRKSKTAPEPDPGSDERRASSARLEDASAAFRDVEPPGFGDHPHSALEAALSDPDVDDSEGGE